MILMSKLLILSFFLTGCLQAIKNSDSQQTSYSGLGSESLSAETIKAFAPPALGDEISKQIQRMLDIREPARGIPSNDGESIYFTWNVTGKYQVWKTSKKQGFPEQLTGGENPAYLTGLLPNDEFLVISRDQKGEENPGLYLLSSAGGKLKKIFHEPKVQASFQGASEDSQFVYFSANSKNPKDRTLYRFHIPTGQIEKIFDEPGTWVIADMKGNERLLLAKLTGALSREFFEFNLNTKNLIPVLGQGKSEDIIVSYGPNTGEFFVLTNMLSNFKRLYSLKNGSFNPISEEVNFDGESYSIDDQRKRLTYSINENGWNRPHFLDARSLSPLPLPKIEADQLSIGNFSFNGRFLTMTVEVDGGPASVYLYDFDSKTFAPRISPQAPEIDTQGFSEASIEYYTARDGTKIPMLVRKPVVCADPCPVIIHFHGGPEAQSRPGFSAFSQIFVDAGFVFVEPNVRGSSGYGKDWISADDGAKRLNVITDIEDASVWIKANWKSGDQAPKVGIMGYSYGGYSTLLGMTQFADSFDAGVALVGMSNLVSFLENTAPYRRHLRISEYGDPEKDREALLKLSPVTYVDRAKNPLLIIHGVSDPRVPAGEAVQIYQKLKDRAVDVSLILMSDEGHGSASRSSQALEIGHTVDFFAKKLQRK